MTSCAIRVICVFGPSCSGKSTLTKALKNKLGDGWRRIDRDELPGNDVDTTLDRIIALSADKLIIDAQIPWREKRDGELYVSVLPPLNILLQRYEKRMSNRKRTPERALQAKLYVENTFKIISEKPEGTFDFPLDSSKLSVEEEVEIIFSKLVVHAQ